MLVVVILEKGGPAMKPLNVKTEEVYIYIYSTVEPTGGSPKDDHFHVFFVFSNKNPSTKCTFKIKHSK